MVNFTKITYLYPLKISTHPCYFFISSLSSYFLNFQWLNEIFEFIVSTIEAHEESKLMNFVKTQLKLRIIFI